MRITDENRKFALSILKLPLEARKALLAVLLASLECDDEEEPPKVVAAAWDAEIDHHDREFEAGRVATAPWCVI